MGARAELRMPKLGLTMEEGTIVEWLVPPGGTVEADAAVLVIETDKVQTEVVSPHGGVLRPVGQVGETYACGDLIAWVDGAGEELPEPATASAAEAAAPGRRANGAGRLLASPNARRVAAELGVDLGTVSGTGPGGRIVSEDVEALASEPVVRAAPSPAAAPAPQGAPVPASYVATRLAERLGIDVGAVTASGPDGRITRADVLDHARGALATRRTLVPTEREVAETVPLRGARKVIADRMQASLADSAQLTLTMEVDADRMVAMRAELAEIGAAELGAVPTVTDLVVAATARALRAHPRLNSRVFGDRIEVLADIDVGVAIAVEDGLVVPVVRAADRLPLPDLALETSRLADAARTGRIGLDELEGATFSVTSLGMFGVDAFTPILNPPNVGILGVGRLRSDTVWLDGRPAETQRLTLSLTWDHRAVDGAPAARFCGAVKELLEQPLRLLA